MKIRKKILLSAILLSILPLLLMVVIFLGHYIKTMIDDQEEYSTNLSDSILERIDGMVDEVDRMLNVVYNVSDFETDITKAAEIPKDAPDYAYRFLQADLTLKNDLSYLVYEKSMIEDIILIDKAGNNFYIGSNLFEYKKDFREEPFYQDIVRANGKCHIFAKGIESLYKEGTEEYFAIAKVIRSRENMENIGAVIVTIPLERLARTFENYLEAETQRCLILSDQEVLLDSSAAAGDDENSVDRWLSYSNRNRVTYGGEDYLINGKTSSGTGLRMIWMSPYRLMREKTYPLIFFIGIIAGVIIVSCSAAAVWISSSISKPVMRLNEMTKRLSGGNFDDDTPTGETVRGNDEVGQLFQSFLQMKKQINELFLKEKKSRTEFLANQINPHFLYNTLDSAYMSAIANDDMDTSEIIGQINVLLKMVVREQSTVSLGKELEIVAAYVAIQKMRYPGKFHYQVFAEEELKRLTIPKMILQPVVENAITHGILELDKRGYIYIKAHGGENVLHIRVINGPGRMTEEELRAMNGAIASRDVYGVKHIGLKNIQERLNLNYPDGVRLFIENSTEYDGIEVNLILDLSTRAGRYGLSAGAGSGGPGGRERR